MTHLGFPQLGEFRLEVVGDSGCCPRKHEPPDEQNSKYYIWQRRSGPYDLPRAFHALEKG